MPRRSEGGRKSLTSIRIDPENLKRMRALAEKDNRSLSELIQQAVDEFLERKLPYKPTELATPNFLRYRLVILNLSLTQELIEQMVEEELGGNVELIDWQEERQYDFEGTVAGCGRMPQHITVVALRYRLK